MNEIYNAFRINQTGYAEGLPVYAAVLAKDSVTLKDNNGKTVPMEEAAALKPDEASGDEVALVNLGKLKAGTYTLESVEGKRTLTVSKKPWKAVTNALIKGLYYQRCGCELKPEHAGIYSHPACHTAPAVDWEDRSVRRHIRGGWHDAGDFDLRVESQSGGAYLLALTWEAFRV